MVMKLAYRNLFHDRMSFFVTIIGIVFSVVLVAVQSGIYLGSQNKISAIIDAAPADLWVIPLGTKSYDDPSFLSGRERHMVLSTPGVENSEDMVVSFASWRKPHGGRNTVLLIGTAGDSPKALPWNIIEAAAKHLKPRTPSPSTKAIFPISASTRSASTPKSTGPPSNSPRSRNGSVRLRRYPSSSPRSKKHADYRAPTRIKPLISV
jgi:putative ABC transport system permease protein